MIILNRLRAVWQGMLPWMRIAVCAIGVACIVAVGAFEVLGTEKIVPLFATPLDPHQLAETDERLAEWEIPHVPTSDNVLIDEHRRNDVLLKLSIAGIPHQHLAGSDEALAKLSAMTPDALLQAQERVGLAGDLAAGLRGIDGVADANVVIAPAQPAAFADETGSPVTAAVRLAVRPGVRLTTATIRGIRAYIAGGVAGLSSDRVTLLDDRGTSLDSEHGDDDGETIRTALQSALDDAFGVGSTIVRVRCRYDARTHDIHDVRRVSLAGPILAHSGSSEIYHAEKRAYQKIENADQRPERERDEHSTVAAGELTGTSVAVLIDESLHLDVAKVRAIAEAVAGIDAQSADHVTATEIPFAKPAMQHGTSPVVLLIAYRSSIVIILCVIACCVGAFHVAPSIASICKFAIERASIKEKRTAYTGVAPATVHATLQHEPPHAAAAILSALPASTVAGVLDLYSPEARTLITARMTSAPTSYVPSWEQLRHDANPFGK